MPHLLSVARNAVIFATLVACGAPPAAAPPPAAMPGSAATVVTVDADFDPTGRYELMLDRGTERLVLVATIYVRPDGTLAGVVSSATAPMLTIRTGTIKGRALTMRVAAESGTEARLEMVVDGERVSGRWTRDSGDFLRVTGRRLR